MAIIRPDIKLLQLSRIFWEHTVASECQGLMQVFASVARLYISLPEASHAIRLANGQLPCDAA